MLPRRGKYPHTAGGQYVPSCRNRHGSHHHMVLLAERSERKVLREVPEILVRKQDQCLQCPEADLDPFNLFLVNEILY